MPLTPKQMLYLALAWQCFESEPKIDYARLATLASLSSPASARELVRQSKKKLFEENSITDDLINKPSPAADATKPTKAKKATGTKKPIGRPRKKLASLTADDDDTKSHPDVDEQSSAADADADTPTPSIPKALAGKGKPRAPATTTAHHPELAPDTDVNVDDDETDKAGTAIQATIGNKSAKGPKGTGKAAGAAAATAKKRRAPGAADEAVGPMGLLDEGTVAKKVKKGGVKVKAEPTQNEEIWTEGLGIEDGEEGEMAF